MSHIAVIGAGITGTTTAYALLKRGYKVSIFEKHPYAAMETAFANGGQLSAGRTHSVGYVHEACLQLWGRANGRQIKDAQVAVTSAGGGPLGGSLLLVRE